jgi:hypothetical protein
MQEQDVAQTILAITTALALEALAHGVPKQVQITLVMIIPQ